MPRLLWEGEIHWMGGWTMSLILFISRNSVPGVFLLLLRGIHVANLEVLRYVPLCSMLSNAFQSVCEG